MYLNFEKYVYIYDIMIYMKFYVIKIMDIMNILNEIFGILEIIIII